jgi:hypothetical protein
VQAIGIAVVTIVVIVNGDSSSLGQQERSRVARIEIRA